MDRMTGTTHTSGAATTAREALLLFPRLNNTIFAGMFEPLIMEILSAIAKEEGWTTTVLDMRFEGRVLERMARNSYSPGVIAMTTHGFQEVPIVNDLVARCKRLWPSVPIVVGGGQATLTPELLDQERIDMIVRGPGEVLWRRLCRDGFESSDTCRILQEEKPAREYRFPVPDRESTRKYRRRYRTFIPHHTGRPFGRTGFTQFTQGCPFRCSFCVIWPSMLGLYRKRPVEDVVADLQNIEEPFVFVGDDNTFVDIKYANRLAAAIRAAGIRKEYHVFFRTDTVVRHPDLIGTWHELGATHAVVGLEAMSDETLQGLNKGTSADDNEKALDILREIGIYPMAHLIITPDMREADFDRILAFIERHRLEYPILPIMTPLPGTKLFEEAVDQGRLATRDLKYYSLNHSVMWPRISR